MNKDCPIYQIANFIGKRWTLLVITEISKSPDGFLRYTQLKDKLPGITPKILSYRLKELEKEGLIEKKVDLTKFPVKCEYKLTNKGKGFIKILKTMKEWGLEWGIKNKECETVNCDQCSL